MAKLTKYFVPVRQTDALPERQAKAMGVKPYALNPPTANESYKRFVKPHALPVKMNGGGEMRGTNDDHSSPEEHFGRPKNTTEVGSPYNNSSAASNARPSPNLMLRTPVGYADGGNVADEYVGHKMSEGGGVGVDDTDMEAAREAYAAQKAQRMHDQEMDPAKVAAGAAQSRADAAASLNTVAPPQADLNSQQQAQLSISKALGTDSPLAQIQRGATMSGPAFKAMEAAQAQQGGVGNINTPPNMHNSPLPSYAKGGRIMGSPALSPEHLKELQSMIAHPNTTQKYAMGTPPGGAQPPVSPQLLAALQAQHSSPQPPVNPAALQQAMMQQKKQAAMKAALAHAQQLSPRGYYEGGNVADQYVGHKMADGGEVTPEMLEAISKDISNIYKNNTEDDNSFKKGFQTEAGKTGQGTRMSKGGSVADEYVGHRMAKGGEAGDSFDLDSLMKGLPKEGSKTIVIKGGNMSPEDEQDARRATMQALQQMMNMLQEEDEDSVNDKPKPKKKK